MMTCGWCTGKDNELGVKCWLDQRQLLLHLWDVWFAYFLGTSMDRKALHKVCCVAVIRRSRPPSCLCGKMAEGAHRRHGTRPTDYSANPDVTSPDPSQVCLSLFQKVRRRVWTSPAEVWGWGAGRHPSCPSRNQGRESARLVYQ